jgi:hypothetical protein
VRGLTWTMAAALCCLAILPGRAVAEGTGAVAAAVPDERAAPEAAGPAVAPPPAPDAAQAALPTVLPPSPQAPKPAEWSLEACKVIYKDKAVDLKNRMFSFQPVYGKKAINWTEKDYVDLLALAAACNGVIVGGGDRFDAKAWPGTVNMVRQRMLPVSQVAKVIAERTSRIKPEAIRVPSCEDFLQFSFDAYETADSSERVFGQSFLAMSLADLERSVSYTNLCLAYLPDYAQIAAGMRKEVTRDLLNRVMDRALIVQKRRLEWEALPRYDTDLVLDREGIVIPTTMLSPDAREMVARFNRSSALRRPFSPEAIGLLLRMADDVLRDDRSAFDKLYANAVRARCQQEIFRKQ